MTEAERRARMEKALASGGGTHTLGDLALLVKQERARWWQSDDGDGMVVTEFYTYPRCKMLRYWLIAGKLESCLSLEPQIEEWARGEGCTVATATGRRGWTPIVTKRGWRLWHPNYWKPLEGEQP